MNRLIVACLLSCFAFHLQAAEAGNKSDLNRQAQEYATIVKATADLLEIGAQELSNPSLKTQAASDSEHFRLKALSEADSLANLFHGAVELLKNRGYQLSESMETRGYIKSTGFISSSVGRHQLFPTIYYLEAVPKEITDPTVANSLSKKNISEIDQRIGEAVSRAQWEWNNIRREYDNFQKKSEASKQEEPLKTPQQKQSKPKSKSWFRSNL